MSGQAIFEYQKIFDVIVWSVPAARSITNVRELLIDTPGADMCVSTTWQRCACCPRQARSSGRHFATINIMANVRGRDVNSATADARRLKSLNFQRVLPRLLAEEWRARSPAGHAWCIGRVDRDLLSCKLVSQLAFGLACPSRAVVLSDR
jgi:hypothetical protein